MNKRLLLTCLIVSVVLSGCVTTGDTPAKAYDGSSRPAGEVATFKCGFGVAVRAIDGNSEFNGNPLTCAFQLLPGKHRLRVQFSDRNASPGMVASSRTDYIVPLDMVAGRTYMLNAFLKDDTNAPMPWLIKLTDSSQKYVIIVTDVHKVSPE